MVCIKNTNLTVYCREDGRGLSFVDRQRNACWEMDEKTLVYALPGGKRCDEAELRPLIPCAAIHEGENTIIVSYKIEKAEIRMHYVLFDNYFEVRLEVPLDPEIGVVSMPGSFRPDSGQMKLVMPILQGVLWDGRGPAFERRMEEGGHGGGFYMGMFGCLSDCGGLLLTLETRDDILWWYGKDAAGRIWCSNLQVKSLGTMRYERVVRFYPSDPDITGIAKTYRRRVIERGGFKSWEEKIAERPALERLFGTLMCFIGYCRDDIDYAAECKKLKDYGFDRALVYPARFNIYHKDILMGGRPPIDLDHKQVEGIKSLGFDIAPWTWINEALDDKTEQIRRMYRKTPEGSYIPNWKIDDQQWYLCCTTFMEDYQKNAMNSVISDMTWDHFDVITCATNGECYAKDHPGHYGYPLSRTEDRKWIKKLLSASRDAGFIVRSESLNDAYSSDYDLGSVKMLPNFGHWPFWPVPLTMLVYHDSMIHTWWELHSYNNKWHGNVRELKFYQYGGGRPGQMAAMDALMGCPPDVFPFGMQYMWAGRGQETFAYRFRFEDPEVQLALREALLVAKLHRRIGKQEMVDFKILSQDGYVQQTVFTDGTSIVANFCNQVRGDIPGIEPLQGESWRAVQND